MSLTSLIRTGAIFGAAAKKARDAYKPSSGGSNSNSGSGSGSSGGAKTPTTIWDPSGNARQGYIQNGATYYDDGTRITSGSRVVDNSGREWKMGKTGGSLTGVNYANQGNERTISNTTNDTSANDYYSNILSEQQKSAQLRTQAALQANNAFIPQVNQLADQRLQDSYIAREMARVNMPQQLSAMGYSGGAAETTLLGLDTTYQNNRNSIEQDRGNALEGIRQNAAQIQATGDAGLADISANYYQNMFNKQLREAEQAQSDYRWQTELDLDRSDASYRDQLEMAKLKASYGDYSGLQALGINVNALNDMNGSTPMTKAAPAKVTATTPTSSGNYNTVLNNVKRALGGSNMGSQVAWNQVINYIQNEFRKGTITEYEAQQMINQLGLD